MTASPRSCLWKWYLCGLLFMQFACAHRKTVQLVPNPMDAVWSHTRDDIDELENRHAGEQDWRKASEPETRVVNSIPALSDQIKDLSLSDAEREALSMAFKQSSRVIHFGFACNYHALVFFDESGKAWKVIKW